MQEWLLAAALCGLSWRDIRKKTIPLSWLFAFCAGGLVCFLLASDRSWYEPAAAAGAALLLALLSRLTGGAVCLGDAWVLLGLGLFLGPAGSLLVLFAGLFLSAVYSAVLLIRRKADRKTTLPFVPFLGISYGLLYLLHLNGGGMYGS